MSECSRRIKIDKMRELLNAKRQPQVRFYCAFLRVFPLQWWSGLSKMGGFRHLSYPMFSLFWLIIIIIIICNKVFLYLLKTFKDSTHKGWTFRGDYTEFIIFFIFTNFLLFAKNILYLGSLFKSRSFSVSLLLAKKNNILYIYVSIDS